MIRIICVGKLKETYLVDAVNDYQKRINKYHHLEIIQLDDNGIDNEKISILKNIRDKDYVITLEIDGSKYNSLEFANKIDNIFNINSNITFIIGGSDGIHNDVKKRSNLAISFSNLTFPHGLFRVILLEQLYRTFKINNHESYHK